MDKIILGTAFITDKGDWVSGTAYEINDLVHTSKGVYMSLIDNNTEEPPTSNWRLWVDTEAVNNVNNILATKVDKDEIINSNGDLMTNTATITSTTVDLNDYVDLGLPSGTLWSKYNYGSSSETASGLYFQWGATVGYSASDATSHSSWTTCPGNNGNSSYDASSFTAWMSGNIHSKLLCDDVDAVQVGTVGGAKMPTQSQYNELLTNTTWSWTTINGVAGSKFSNKNDTSKYIFIPVSGYINGTSATSTNTCYIWSKTLADSTNQGAYGLVITSSGASWGTLNRQVSMPIRSVVVASKVTLPQGEGVLALKSDIVLPTATSYTLGGVKSSTTGTTANRDYKVEVNTDGTMKVNVPWVDTNTTYSNATTSAAGLLSTSDKSKLDGIAANANNYTLPTASTTALGGIKVGTNLSISDGVLSSKDTTYSAATQSANGLMSSTDKTKLDGIDAGANKYVHPSYTQASSGLYKITVDSTGHVSATTTVNKSDITSLGIPSQDTVYTLPEATTTALGGVKVDAALSTTSTNPVQNKIVKIAIDEINSQLSWAKID